MSNLNRFVGNIVITLVLMSACNLMGSPVTENIEKQKDSQKEFKKRAEALVGDMTLSEKASQFDMQSPAIPHLGIPAHDWWNEALHGVGRNGKATQFPQSICMASTWNPDLIQRMADAISDEARAKHHQRPGRNKRYQGLTIWSPTINMARDPRWGRNEETYGEDPLLTGDIGVAFVLGLQGDHPRYYKTIATVKHFIANNTEYNRTRVCNPVSQRALREYYMPAFREAVRSGNVQSIMTAYNGINEIPCTADQWLLTDVLKNEWGFLGTVVTDVSAPSRITSDHHYTKNHIEGAAAMLKAGVDVSSGRRRFSGSAIRAIAQGLVTEADLERAIIQNLATRLQLGQGIDDADNPYKTIPMSVVGSKEHCQIARQIAREGIVLLKNDAVKNAPLLPIDRKRIRKIIVTGPYARKAQLGGYSGTPTHSGITPLIGIQNAAKDISVTYRPWKSAGTWTAIPSAMLKPGADMDADHGLKAEYFAGTACSGEPKMTRVDTQIDFSWPKPLSHIDPDIPQPKFAVRWTGTLVPEITGNYRLAGRCDDGVRIWLDDKLIVDDWSDHAVRRAASKTLPLKANHAYALRVEYYDSRQNAEAHLEWQVPTAEGHGIAADENSDTLVVYVGGFNIHMADEANDLMNLRFPADQMADLRTISSKYPNTVLVLNGGSIITEPEIFESIPTVMQAWYPGQEGGDALADLIFGHVSPSGRTPMTWYKTTNELPGFDDYEISKGRTYQYFDKEVQFPFGHGLSYTTFEYAEFKVSKSKCKADDTVKASVTVKNTGSVDADEVVQIYAHNEDSPVYQPIKKLVGYKRVSIPKGGSKRVSIEIPVERLAHWDDASEKFVVEPGAFTLMVGASSADIRCMKNLTVK